MSEMSEGMEKRAVVIEGGLVVPPGARFALVASRFNHFIVDRLVEGALDAIVRHGGDASKITIVRVPGAWEIPTVVARLAHRKSADAQPHTTPTIAQTAPPRRQSARWIQALGGIRSTCPSRKRSRSSSLQMRPHSRYPAFDS